MQDFFDATQVQPVQGGEKHPAGMFDFQITNTNAQQTKDQSGGYLVVEFTSPAGVIVNRYNLWNASAQAVEIAQKQLSALCHATGIFRLTFPKKPDGSMDCENAARELRGGRGRMEVAPQKNQPDYNEVKKVFDASGNEPGKTGGTPQPQGGNAGWGTQQPQPPAQQQPPQMPMQPAPQQPMQQQPSGGWGQATTQQPQPQQQPPQANPGWQQNQPPQQGNAPPQSPPWAR